MAKRFSIHSGGQPNSPEILTELDQNTLQTIWDSQRWGRLGLARVEAHPEQQGYDKHVLVYYEDGTVIDGWMWSFD